MMKWIEIVKFCLRDHESEIIIRLSSEFWKSGIIQLTMFHISVIILEL